MVKNPPANSGDTGLIPGLGRSLGEGNGSPLQYSCLENPIVRGVWQATQAMGSQDSDMKERLNNNNRSHLMAAKSCCIRCSLKEISAFSHFCMFWFVLKFPQCKSFNRPGHHSLSDFPSSLQVPKPCQRQ